VELADLGGRTLVLTPPGGDLPAIREWVKTPLGLGRCWPTQKMAPSVWCAHSIYARESAEWCGAVPRTWFRRWTRNEGRSSAPKQSEFARNRVAGAIAGGRAIALCGFNIALLATAGWPDIFPASAVPSSPSCAAPACRPPSGEPNRRSGRWCRPQSLGRQPHRHRRPHAIGAAQPDSHLPPAAAPLGAAVPTPALRSPPHDAAPRGAVNKYL